MVEEGTIDKKTQGRWHITPTVRRIYRERKKERKGNARRYIARAACNSLS
jgi:hypothetical protein